MRRVVIVRLCDFNTIVRVFGKCYAVIISLDMFVAASLHAHFFLGNSPQKSAFRLAFHLVRVYICPELVIYRYLHTVICLVVLRIRLSSYGIRDVGFRH